MFKLKMLLVSSGILSTVFGGMWLIGGDKAPSMPCKVKVEGKFNTLWAIASKYNGGDSNTGRVVYWIQEENHLTTSVLQPGQVLQVPAPSDN